MMTVCGITLIARIELRSMIDVYTLMCKTPSARGEAESVESNPPTYASTECQVRKLLSTDRTRLFVYAER